MVFAGLGIAALIPLSPAFSAGAQAAEPEHSPIAGLATDSDKPIAVNADSFLADLNGEIGTYTGNVIVTQGAVKLHADEVKVHTPGGKAARMEAFGHVVVDSPSGEAVGDTGIYDVSDQMVHLFGHVVLTKDTSVMRGTALEVSMATGLAKLTAAGTQTAQAGATPAGGTGQEAPSVAPGEPAGRVQGLFAPAQKSAPNAAKPAAKP
jgi:lipopolysaccharide export system protein LptA